MNETEGKTMETWDKVIEDIADKKAKNEEIDAVLEKHKITERELLVAIWEKAKS
jgi:hypothetical protein